jgi:hypothetical protein
MGVNAQTAVPVFTAGQILTAAQMTQVNTGIPVFATTVTRDAAFDGAGEKVLAEGQFAYIEATNTTQYYDGAAWQPIGTPPGLVCVKAETAFSAVANITADNVFTSSYTDYLIIFRYSTSTGQDPTMQFRAATVDTTSGYTFQRLTGISTSVATSNTNGFSSGHIGGHTSSSSFQSFSTVQISGVQLAQPTFYYSLNNRCDGSYTTGQNIFQFFGNQSSSTAFDGLKILVASGTMTGSYTIYGYSKTV